jgi:Family of unknown function (DUF5906)/Bifunctional DNA primase/polymerase, N-terminal
MPFQYDAVQLFDLGYGPRLISVTPPGCDLAPGTKIIPKDRGKAPGYPTAEGWTGANVNDPRRRCHDFLVAKNWRDNWGANTGLVAGQGLVILDNDQGREFSQILRTLLPRAPRRFVLDPKHERDAFLVLVVDGDSMEPENVANSDPKFRNGLRTAGIQILARGKQAVIGGIHPDTRMPYVWENELPPIEQIPAITLTQFEAIVGEFLDQARNLGWEPITRKLVSAPVSAFPPLGAAPQKSAQTDTDAYAEADALLAQIPNRDVPPADADIVDKWLDDKQNWLDVGYATAAFFSPSDRLTPEARAVWVPWSDGRVQGWNSDKVWDSIIHADLRFGAIKLVEIVRQFRPAPIDFPDLDPSEFPPDEPPSPPRARPIWDELRARWAYCKAKGFIDTVTGRAYDRGAFSDGEMRWGKALCRELGLRGRTPSVASMFLRQPDMIEVFDLTYAPGEGRFVPSSDPALYSFNRWKATTILAEPIAKSHIQKWLDHLEFVLGSAQERDRFLRWCAFVAQHPELKPNWHFLVISDAGLGKDTMTAPIKLAVGDNNWEDILSYALAQPFNPWAERKLVIIGETSQSKHDAIEVANRLKPLLAAPPIYLTINDKHVKQYRIPNRTAVILFSNSQNPLYLERGSRRVHVVNRLGCSARETAYYTDMINWLDRGGAALCAAYLLTLQLSDAEIDEFKGVAPSTTDKAQLEEQNVSPPLSLLEELIADARAGITTDTPYNLVASAQELVGYLKLRDMRVTAQSISAWLMTMPGVRRLRVDQKYPARCGVISAVVNGVTYSGRLWALSETTADGRPWSALTEAEIIAIWKNLAPPRKGTIIPFPSKAGGEFPDEEKV